MATQWKCMRMYQNKKALHTAHVALIYFSPIEKRGFFFSIIPRKQVHKTVEI